LAPLSPEYLQAAVARLTGDRNPIGNHVYLYRIKVRSNDGKDCGVFVRVGRKNAYKTNLRQIADSFRMEVDWMIENRVLDDWAESDMRRHLEQFSAEVLDSPANVRRFRG
jgi:hypothetical protein